MRGQPAGRRYKRLMIEKFTEGDHDALGATTKTWKKYVVRWASVLPKTSREYWASNQIHADMTHMLEMSYVPNLTSEMRINFGGRILNIIEAINLEELNVTHRLVCSEIVGG